jgi:hypothetical protein
MSDSTALDQAVMDALLADPILRALLPDGVFWEQAGASLVDGGPATRCVIVSLVEAHDEPMFGGRAYEECVYEIKAVVLSTVVGASVTAAAARIDALLDPQPSRRPTPLVIPGYQLMVLRRQARIRMTEVDDQDTTIRWFHRGGHYQLMASPVTS